MREVCKKDRSIAIAHGLEDICEVKAPEAKKKGKGKETGKSEAKGLKSKNAADETQETMELI